MNAQTVQAQRDYWRCEAIRKLESSNNIPGVFQTDSNRKVWRDTFRREFMRANGTKRFYRAMMERVSK